MDNDNKTLENREKSLEKVITGENNNWVELFILMNEVEKERLYRNEYSSFSSWVYHLASLYQLHPSGIWAKYQAGKIYSQYLERAQEKNKPVKSLLESNISPNNLVLIEKIYPNDTLLKDTLIEQVQNKMIKQSELKQMWKDKKDDLKSDNSKLILPRNSNEKQKARSTGYFVNKNSDNFNQYLFTSISSRFAKIQNDYQSNKQVHKHKIFRDFKIKGIDLNFDFLTVENTRCAPDYLKIVGYINYSKPKYQDIVFYKEFCDELYLFITDKNAEKHFDDIFGVISLNKDNEVVYEKNATFKKAIYREEVLTAILDKLI